jgi:NAD(P)H dehydrogenase (quinone)
MILVTGAGGKTGRAVISALAARGVMVRAFVRREEQAAEVKRLGAVDASIGDLRDAAAVQAALRGVQKVYHVCPNGHPDEVVIGQIIIAAARATGVEQFVFHSVLHPQTEKMPHHWRKLRVEEMLFESGLSITILQPTAYMQNILAGWEAISQRGVYTIPYPVETRLSLVDLKDVAEAAALVLTEPVHLGAAYELVGTPAMSQVEVAMELSQALGREVRAEAIPIEQWETQARRSGLNDYAVETLAAMFRYYAHYGLIGSPNVLRWLLGRPATTLADFVRSPSSLSSSA